MKAMRGLRYDLVIDLQGLLKSALVSKLVKAGRVIGPSFHREGSHLLYDRVAGTCDRNRHAVEEAMDVVRFLGLPVPPVEFPVVFPAVEMLTGRPRVAVVPSSRRENKNWPVEFYAEVAHRLMHQDSASIYLMGGRSDRETCATLQHALEAGNTSSRVVNLAGRTTLVEMGGWLKGMDVVLANDSGPMHMAVAIKIPVVAMFGPTDPVRTGPYGAGNRVVTVAMDCQPCFKRTCPLEGIDCMRAITQEAVYGAVKELLARRAP
jgi:lipopolysaccharide heptosyltransferase II